MNILTTIGDKDTTVQYTDRPTVKVVIKQDVKLLLLNEGLLPRGGIEPGESDQMRLNESCKKSSALL